MSDVNAPSIDGFTQLTRIGTGGFSSVYRAHQPEMGRDVAIKVLHADFSSERDRRTFERECRVLGVLSRHPHIVTVYSSAITSEGRPCIVMELYGANYRERLASGPLDVAEVLRVGVKTASALEAAHRGGVLHRDVKPHNVFVSDYGEPALGDFGISTVDDERSITAASGLSVAYAAPEVLEEEAATVAADVYGLAASLFHLLEGAPPFRSPQLRATVRKILAEPPPMPSSPGVPERLGQVLVRALAKRPEQRPPSARAFADELREIERSVGWEPTAFVLPRSEGDAPTIETEAAPTTETEAAPTTETEAAPDRDRERTIVRGRPRGRQDDDPNASPARPAAARGSRAASASDPVRSGPSALAGAGHVEGVRSDVPAIDPAIDDIEGTVRRERPVPVGPHAATDDGRSGPSTGRKWLAAGVAVAVAGVVAVGVVLAGRDDGENPVTTTTVSEVAAVDDETGAFFEVLGPPDDVVVQVGDAGTVTVSFDPVPGAVSYEVVSLAPSERLGVVRTVAASAGSAAEDGVVVDTGLTADEAACWVVRSVGEQRRSADSELRCAGL